METATIDQAAETNEQAPTEATDPAQEQASGATSESPGTPSSIEGFIWREASETPRTEGAPCLNLISPASLTAATVFTTEDEGGYRWIVWDEAGVGGENGAESTISASMLAAEAALLRWGKHGIQSPVADPTPATEAEKTAEKVGSKEPTEDSRDAHLREIEAAEITVSEREMKWEALKAETKEAKDSFDAAVERLRKIIRHSGGPGPLFEQPKVSEPAPAAPVDAPPIHRERLVWKEESIDDSGVKLTRLSAANTAGIIAPWRDNTTALYWIETANGTDIETAPDSELLPAGTDEDAFVTSFKTVEAAKEWCQARDDELYAAAHPPAVAESKPAPTDGPDPRLSIRLDTLKIKPALLTKLAEHRPSLLTVGDIADWCNQRSREHGGNNELSDIAGIGPEKVAQINAAMDPLWFTPAEPAGKPTQNIPATEQHVSPASVEQEVATPAEMQLAFNLDLGSGDTHSGAAIIYGKKSEEGTWAWAGFYFVGVSEKTWRPRGQHPTPALAILSGARQMKESITARIENSSGAALNHAREIDEVLAKIIADNGVIPALEATSPETPKRTRGKRAKAAV